MSVLLRKGPIKKLAWGLVSTVGKIDPPPPPPAHPLYAAAVELQSPYNINYAISVDLRY